ncbi:MAG TPA: type II toxin-antitoxin system prevent-host-death family antitoxin [Fimbriimonas sp.]|nr:type II toxin-antitoxin system prevent-host-death family antitoxin [Fimbriimonas sp.]
MLITATEFKAKCLQLLDKVGMTGETIRVTKRGKVVAELVPPSSGKRKFAEPGFAKGKMKIVGDIVGPLNEEWEAMK